MVRNRLRKWEREEESFNKENSRKHENEKSVEEEEKKEERKKEGLGEKPMKERSYSNEEMCKR